MTAIEKAKATIGLIAQAILVAALIFMASFIAAWGS